MLKGRIAGVAGHSHLHFNFPDNNSDCSQTAPQRVLNRQDMIGIEFLEIDGELGVVVVVCDGGSEAETSEVGAGLLSQLSAAKIRALVIKHGPSQELQINKAFNIWFQRTIRRLISLHPYGKRYLTLLDEERRTGQYLLDVDSDWKLRSVYNWLLRSFSFTFLAGYFGAGRVLTLRRGDGGFAVDDLVLTEDYNNMPPYYVYEFLPRFKIEAGIAAKKEEGKEPVLLPPGFTSTYHEDVTNFAVFSDGFPTQRLNEVWPLLNPVDMWGDKSRNKLELRLRKWWTEPLVLDMPDKGWLINDDVMIAAFSRA